MFVHNKNPPPNLNSNRLMKSYCLNRWIYYKKVSIYNVIRMTHSFEYILSTDSRAHVFIPVFGGYVCSSFQVSVFVFVFLYFVFIFFIYFFCLTGLRAVSCLSNVSSVSGLSILDCLFGFVQRLFINI